MKTNTSLDYLDALKIIEAIKIELVHRQKAAVITVADDHGELLALLRLDGVSLPCITVAMNKAWTAARERTETYGLGQAARDPKAGFDMAYYGDPRYIGWGGGIPVIYEEKVVGAIAVSGLSEAEDAELAKIGLAAIIN